MIPVTEMATEKTVRSIGGVVLGVDSEKRSFFFSQRVFQKKKKMVILRGFECHPRNLRQHFRPQKSSVTLWNMGFLDRIMFGQRLGPPDSPRS